MARSGKDAVIPSWLARSTALSAGLAILRDHVPVDCSIAPLLPGTTWVVLNARRLVLRGIEARADGGKRRARYDAKNIQIVRRTRKTRLAHLGARHDLVVPIVRDGRVESLLLAGPFLTREPTARSVRREWRLIFRR